MLHNCQNRDHSETRWASHSFIHSFSILSVCLSVCVDYTGNGQAIRMKMIEDLCLLACDTVDLCIFTDVMKELAASIFRV